MKQMILRKLINLRALVVLLLFSLFLSSNSITWAAMSFTFDGLVEGNSMNFTVVGDVGGSNNIIPAPSGNGVVWQEEWDIGYISNWALLMEPFPSNYVNNGNTWGGRMIYPTSFPGYDYSFQYGERFEGNNLQTLETWGHNIRINSLMIFSNINELVGVADAFSYEEGTGYATNYTADGSTNAAWIRDSISGTLTLVGVNYDAALYRPNQTFNGGNGGAFVPEPASLSFFGLGLLGLVIKRKKRII